MSPALIIGAVAATIIAGLAWYAQDADDAWERETKKALAAELRADSFAKGLTQCRAEIAEKNAIITHFQGLAVDRLRICVTRPPNDPCCRPAPAPPAKDECKP